MSDETTAEPMPATIEAVRQMESSHRRLGLLPPVSASEPQMRMRALELANASNSGEQYSTVVKRAAAYLAFLEGAPPSHGNGET